MMTESVAAFDDADAAERIASFVKKNDLRLFTVLSARACHFFYRLQATQVGDIRSETKLSQFSKKSMRGDSFCSLLSAEPSSRAATYKGDVKVTRFKGRY
jgi:hypothetical protein